MEAGLLPICQCPNCKTRADLTVFLTASEATDALAALMEVNPTIKAFVRPMLLYVRLFVPEGEEIGYKMMARLFHELGAIINKGTVEKSGYTYKVTPSMWSQAFQVVRESKGLDLPLTGHSYYLGIVGNLAREYDKKGHGAGSKSSHAPSASNAPTREPMRMPTADEKQRALERKEKLDRLYGRGSARVAV